MSSSLGVHAREKLPVVGSPVLGLRPAKEQSENSHEDRGPHHGIDGGKDATAAKVYLQKRRQVQSVRHPATERRSDEPQGDRAQTAECMGSSSDPGADRAAY